MKKKFLIIYAVIITIALIAILFIIPDKAFLKDKEGYEEFIKNAEKNELNVEKLFSSCQNCEKE